MSNILLTWLEIELSSTVTKRYAISGWPISYGGNTYDNDGTLISTGDLKFVLDLENTPFEVTLSLTDSDVLASINDLTYRYRDATLYVGMWDSANAQIDSDTVKIKNGYVDTHSDPTADHTVSFTISSYVNLASQTRTDISASAAHRIKLLDGVFGDSNKNVNDTVFDSVNRDFSQIVLGNVKATSSRIQIGGARPCSRSDHWFGQDPIYQTVNTPAQSGVRLENVGELYHTPVAYGRVKVNDQIVNAWNPTESAVLNTYNTVTWNSDTVNANVESSTKYLTIAYVVAHGPVDNVQMYSNHSDATYNILTSSGADKQLSFVYADDNSSRGAIAAIECTRGEFDQTAIQRAINISNGSWTSNDRGIGYCLVVITMIASDQWPDGLPEFTFIVDSTKIKRVTASGVAATRTKTSRAGDVMYDFMTSEQYGMALPSTLFETDSFNDFQINAPTIYPRNLRGSITGPGSYTRFLERMQQSAACRIYEEDGKIRVWYGESLVDADIAKEFISDGTTSTNCVISQRNPRSRTVLNECRGRYFALFDATDELPDNLQKTVIITDTDYLAQDNNIKSTATLDLDFLTLDGDQDGFVSNSDKVLVEQVTNLKLQKSRFFQEVIITTDYETASGLKLGQLVRCDVDRYGWTGSNRRLFIIREIIYGQGGSVELTCQRHSNTVYGGVDSFSNLDIENQFPVRTNNIQNINDYAPTIDGTSQQRITIYRRAAATPGTPVGGSYNFTTSDLTPPAGWHELPPVGSGNLYATVGTASITGFEGTDSNITWDTPQLLAESPPDQETIYRFHSNFADNDPGAPTGSNGTGGGWVVDTDDPHWEAVTTVDIAGASARTIEFDIDGVSGESPVTKAFDTEQQYTLTFTGTPGDALAFNKQQTIVDYTFSGVTANAPDTEDIYGYAFTFPINNNEISGALDSSYSFDITIADPADPDSTMTVSVTPSNAGSGSTAHKLTEAMQTALETVSGITVTNPDSASAPIDVSSDVAQQYINSSIITTGAYGTSGAFKSYNDSELNNLNGSYLEGSTQPKFILIEDDGSSAFGATKQYIQARSNTQLFVSTGEATDGLTTFSGAYRMHSFDTDANGNMIVGVIAMSSLAASGNNVHDELFFNVGEIPFKHDPGQDPKSHDYHWADETVGFTYDSDDLDFPAPSLSNFGSGWDNADTDLIFTSAFQVNLGATNGTRTTVTINDGSTTHTYTSDSAAADSSVAVGVVSAINSNFGTEFTASLESSRIVRVETDTDTDGKLTIAVVDGVNGTDVIGDTDNNLSVADNLVQQGYDMDTDLGGVDGTVTILYGGDVVDTVNAGGLDSDGVAEAVAEAINNDGANRYSATSSNNVVTATATFDGTDNPLTISVAVGEDTDGVAGTLAGARAVIEDGTVDRSVGVLSTYTVTEGTTQIATGTLTSASTATSVANTIASAITANSSNYSTSLSGDIITAALDSNGSSPDLSITFAVGEDTEGNGATIRSVKTVIDEGGDGTTDLTDADWRYFVINQEVRIDTDLLRMESDNEISVNRGLILDSSVYNVVSGTDGTASLGTHTTGSRLPFFVFVGNIGIDGTLDTDDTDSTIVVRIEYSTDGGSTYQTLATSTSFNFTTNGTFGTFGDFTSPTLPISLATDALANTTYTLRARIFATQKSSFPSNVSAVFSFNGLLLEELRAS